jgi:hypothetical protein
MLKVSVLCGVVLLRYAVEVGLVSQNLELNFLVEHPARASRRFTFYLRLLFTLTMRRCILFEYVRSYDLKSHSRTPRNDCVHS